MFSGSGESACVDAFAAYCSEDEEKARGAMDRVTEATERPEPKRIKERADAIVGEEAMACGERGGTRARKVDCEDRGWLSLPGHVPLT